jgi:2-polyprenyl-6-methoxyphenol hydroxylase-like FAD-dependent oxidoreductase
MEREATRVCIAGGGPAGIMLGYLLARAGIDVTVLEKWPDFFRDFRGDTIHPSTMQILHELGLLEEFLALPHSVMRQMVLHADGREIPVADFARIRARCPYIAFIPQWDFLNFLASKGRALPAFHLLMETEATDLIREDGAVVGLRAKNKDGAFDIRAELVVGADGRHSTVRERSGLASRALGSPIDVLWFRLSARGSDPEQSFGYVGRRQALVLLDRRDYWQCARLIPKGGFEDIKARGIEAFRQDIATLVPMLAPSVGELASFDQVKLLSVAIDRLDTWHAPGLLMIGDSAHAMSPIGGVGINLAIADAVAAANVLVPTLKRGPVRTEALARVRARRMLPTRIIQRMQALMQDRVLAPMIGSPGAARLPLALRLFARIPALRALPAYMIGIGIRAEHIRH